MPNHISIVWLALSLKGYTAYLDNKTIIYNVHYGPVATENCRLMALQTSYQKSDSTLQQSVLCQLSSLFLPGSTETPLDMAKWGKKIILFTLNMYAGFFSYRTGLVLTR